MSVCVVIPVYNEINTIKAILGKVESQEMISEIIVVDDFSNDGTREVLKEFESKPKYKVLYNKKNMGKGASLRYGFAKAVSDIIIVQDADLEYDPSEYPILLNPIIQGKADVVFGSRFIGGPHRVLYFWHSVFNKLLTLLSNMINNINLSDMEVCSKVFKREILNRMTLKSNRFGFEPEFTAKVARLKLRIYEVPIQYHGRTYKEGKKVNWKDGVAAFWWILRFSYFDRRHRLNLQIRSLSCRKSVIRHPEMLTDEWIPANYLPE
jgi:glycosyltransferase involved in cell wall biosynthesis